MEPQVPEAHSQLTQELVAQCFGANLVVQPNGRHYQANLALYLELLNGMKTAMAGIEYQVLHTIADEESVVFDMAVQIERLNGERESFVAMLLMRFDASEKVSLWKEVYLPKSA